MVMVLEAINSVIRDYLDLDDSVNLEENTRLCNLIGKEKETLDPIDLLEIGYILGINLGKYCSGERLNDIGYKMLKDVVMEQRVPQDLKRLTTKIEYEEATAKKLGQKSRIRL